MMRANNDRDSPRPLAILGRVPNAAELALRRILRAKERDQPLFVLDYQGSLAAFLTDKNKGHLHQSPLLWCDLGNRRRPVALFRFKRSPGMRLVLKTFLLACVRLVAAPVPEASVDAAVEMAWRLAENGTVGLAALNRGLRRPEISQWFRREQHVADGVDHLTRLLSWFLRFPAVWSTTEGNNQLEFKRALKANGTLWIEVPGTYFERIEHQVVAWMAEAAIMDMLLSLDGDEVSSSVRQYLPIILYGFPSVCPLTFAAEELRAKHVGLFTFSAAHSLPQAAQSWFAADADCWVAGDIGHVPPGFHTQWFTAAETSRLAELRPGEVWVRSGTDHKATTMRVHLPDHTISLAQHARWHAQKLRRLSPVKQFSSAFADDHSPAPGICDLYRQLCQKDNLFAGWLRVKTHNRHSHGSDQVSIGQFGSGLDRELDQLVEELSRGNYRCQPLRTLRVPKPNGEERILKIACVRDRVVQASCLNLLEPLFEPRFSRFSFAFRPGRSAHHAIALARSMVRSGRSWAVTADIRQCFDSLDHDVLLRLLSDCIGDQDLLQLIRHWISVDVIDFRDIIPAELGVPQGEAISPLLANVYLDPLDKAFEQNRNAFARYADDYLILCDSEAEAQSALQLMSEFLHGVLRLALKPAKTQYCQLLDGVGYLGFQLGVNEISIQPEKLHRAREAVSGLIEIIAASQSTLITKSRALFKLNSLIRGFRNYFLIDDAPRILDQLRDLDAHVEKLVRAGFSSSLSHDMAWVSREMFAPRDITAANAPTSASSMAAVTGAYPSESRSRPTDGWLIRSGGQILNTQENSVSARPEPPHSSVESEADVPAEQDIVLIDERLHVMTRGCYVTVNKDNLVVRRRRQEYYRTPLSALAMLYLEGAGIAISADLTIRLSQVGVPVVFTPLVGNPGAIAQPVQNDRSDLRRQQVLRRNDPDILKAGLTMLAAKVSNQASVLKYFARYRKRTLDPVYPVLTQGAEDIRAIAAILGKLDPCAAGIRASSMGHEGRAAAKYWSALAHLVPNELAFPGRHTRHAVDPMNNAINYVYGMLYGEIWRVLVRAGLDPYFGIIHGAEHDQGSLVFDVIEEYRAPFGDRLVLGMIGRGFMPELDKDGRLRTSSRRKLINAFHRLWRHGIRWRAKARSPSEILEIQTKSLKNMFLGQEEYSPFKFRW